MGNGMVRKVDELGRVVIPKEMRRILNIKTGSSIEMFINDQNQVVLKKFSELENVNSLIETLVEVIYEAFSTPCFVCDDEKILSVCGLSKKDFLFKKVRPRLLKDRYEKVLISEIIETSDCEKECVVFSIICEGFESGKLVIVDRNFDEQKIQSVFILLSFFCGVLVF